MPYGTIKCDNITFDNGGTDKLLTVSGLFFSTSGALTVTGAISGGSVTAPTATFTTLTGTTTAGTTATFTSGSFTSLTGVTTTVTSGIFGLGSAAAPSITFSGDSNTGIYSPGADQLAISTSGVGRLFVDASGQGGIGTTPDASTQLHVYRAGGNVPLLLETNQSTAYAYFRDSGSGAYLNAVGSESNKLLFVANGSQRAQIDSSGRLLVGTSSNSGGATCQVSGSVQASNTFRFPSNTKNGGTCKPTAIETISTDGGTNSATIYGNSRYGAGKWVLLAAFDSSGNAVGVNDAVSGGATFVFCITDAATNFPTT